MEKFQRFVCRDCDTVNPPVFEQVQGDTCLCLDCADARREAVQAVTAPHKAIFAAFGL